MAKVSIKSEELTPFGGIYFSTRLLSPIGHKILSLVAALFRADCLIVLEAQCPMARLLRQQDAEAGSGKGGSGHPPASLPYSPYCVVKGAGWRADSG